mmetsp:Transcript_43603/g.79443  ORF Transcript_43603/g.79443 Transcript_43603/m.79443 type:complete len:427 (-) Transcript_43603:41-1321(-)
MVASPATLLQLEERRRALAAEVDTIRRERAPQGSPHKPLAFLDIPRVSQAFPATCSVPPRQNALPQPSRSPSQNRLPSNAACRAACLTHNELIAKAREVERETASAIERAKSSSPRPLLRSSSSGSSARGSRWDRQDHLRASRGSNNSYMSANLVSSYNNAESRTVSRPAPMAWDSALPITPQRASTTASRLSSPWGGGDSCTSAFEYHSSLFSSQRWASQLMEQYKPMEDIKFTSSSSFLGRQCPADTTLPPAAYPPSPEETQPGPVRVATRTDAPPSTWTQSSPYPAESMCPAAVAASFKPASFSPHRYSAASTSATVASQVADMASQGFFTPTQQHAEAAQGGYRSFSESFADGFRSQPAQASTMDAASHGPVSGMQRWQEGSRPRILPFQDSPPRCLREDSATPKPGGNRRFDGIAPCTYIG